MHLKKFLKAYWLHNWNKNANICEKTIFLTIFVKKSSFLGAKKKFDAIFFVEVTKKNKKWLYQMKVGIKLVKV